MGTIVQAQQQSPTGEGENFMQNQNWRRVVLVAITAVCVVSFMTAAQALPLAGSHRPATVPADYVITPFGYFHPSCVNQLAEGDVLHQDEKTIEHANGTFDKIQACAYPHYRADGEAVTGDERAAKQPDITHAWVEDAAVTTTSSYGFMYAFWNVPPAPTKNDGQTLYFFNGLEDINDVVSIIQPVLGWNSDYASAWGIASWNCCVSGTVQEAPPTSVSSGDLIFGYMFDNCKAGTKTCTSWDIVTWDLTNRNFSQLTATSNFGQTFNWAFGGVLEVYNILQCGDYPDGPADNYSGGGPAINFYNEGLFNDKFVKIAAPGWKISVATGLSPSCSYSGTLPKEVILTY
jgi:hypothetical protein